MSKVNVLILKNKELRLLNLLKAFAILFFCLFLFIISPYVLIALVLLPYFFLKDEGVEFDFQHNRVRAYKTVFFRKRGTWKSIDDFKNIVILAKNGKKTTSGTIMTSQLEIQLKYYEIYLKNEYHKRFFVYSTDNKKRMEEVSRLINENSKLPIVGY